MAVVAWEPAWVNRGYSQLMGEGYSQFGPKIAGDLEGRERSEGQRRAGGQDQAEETLRVLRALSGVCVPPLT